MATPSLPAPRAVLTSLLDAIIRIPLQPFPQTDTTTTTAQQLPLKKEDGTEKKTSPPQPNALTRVPPSHRHLLITLHVLFPSLLLPALDLLDRGLVARLILETPTPTNSTEAPASFYLVHSAQATSAGTSRRRQRSDGSGSKGKAYIVRLPAWNCTCAAFAFAAFPAAESGGWGVTGGEGMGVDVDVGPGETVAGLSFGGFTFDDSDGMGEGVPVCKHILACLLAERWSGPLGGYVVERRVGREEMAGIVADV